MLNILIIDDSMLIRSMVSAALKQIQLHPLEAENSMQALAIGTSTHIDVILLDVELEETSGPELCQQLKQVPNLVDVPVIMMSGYEAEEFENLPPHQTPDFFLQKPFTIQDIQHLVQRALSYSNS